MRREAIAFILICGLLFLASQDRSQEGWSTSLAKVETVATIIQQRYYEPVETDKLLYASIRGVLDTLDPHSYFLDPDSLARMREEYTGKYYGLGIQIQKQEDRLVVISPIEGGPAYRLGILPGDVISHINGESTKPMSSFEAMQKLRGPKGTKVTITIVREGLDKPFDLTIVREEISLKSVPYAFMLKSGVGYIFIRNFAETTIDEFEEKMRDLLSQGMTSLILDLRGNSGGTFFQSVELADEFLPSGSLIVSIKGRNRRYDREFRAQRDRQYEKLPLIILINQGSASASEIVAGAIMDNDRGLIIGEDSWGKGLVQTVFPLGPNIAVALTTAKYFTPSGRSIQRDYTHIEDYMLNKEAPEEQREVRYTSKGRRVLGQGGITPDYKVTSSLKPLTAELLFRGQIFSYARKFAGRQTPLSQKYLFPGDKKSQAGENKKLIDKDFWPDEEMMAEFQQFLQTNKIEFTAEALAEAREEIARELQREIFSLLWGMDEGIRAYRLRDPVVLKAIELMPEAAKMLED
jgi:carboxyl-terminal processing protease